MNLLAKIVMFPDRPDIAIQSWLLTDEGFASAASAVATPELPLVALVPPENVVVRWHHHETLAPRQAEAAARIDAGTASINAADLHIVACEADGITISASIDGELFENGLRYLKAAGFDPDHVWPMGLALPANEGKAIRAELGDLKVIRAGNRLFPDEPGLADIIADGLEIEDIAESDLARYLAAALREASLDLRSGQFAKKSTRAVLDRGKLKLAGIVFALGLLFSLLLALATYMKVDAAIAREDERALAAARQLAPEIANAAEAPARLEQILATRGGGHRSLTIAASAIWRSMQQAEGASLRDMRFGQDKVLNVTVTAVTVDPVNKLLIDLQQKGYKVTATASQEANGMNAVAITVRAP
ncbi:MAG: type II secretion system protein GspL [Sphingorhabdus sp.]